jgi:hypothetical protein
VGWRDRAGHGEEPLVLLVGLVQHGGQAGDVVVVGTFAFLGSLFPCGCRVECRPQQGIFPL